MAKETYDFCGWATRNNIRCSDGRTIMRDAFKDNDGKTVPLVWNHAHNDPGNVIGHGLLENREDGVYIYGAFNDSEMGRRAKNLVLHGDVDALSIYANKLKQNGGYVMHGDIREVSLVLAGANPGAYIESVIRHGEDSEDSEEDAIIYSGSELEIYHSDEPSKNNKDSNTKEDENMADENNKKDSEETVGDVWETLTEKQKTAVYAIIAQAVAENEADENDDSDTKGGTMKHNIFDADSHNEQNYLSHADQENILSIAKSNSVGSLQDAIRIYAEQGGSLAHGFDNVEELFPDYKDVRPGAPETITRDMDWVTAAMQKCNKSPISRIRTRFVDLRQDNLRGHGLKRGNQTKNTGNAKLLKRTTDPQTVYLKDAMNRDDIADISDFDVVEYQYGIMKQYLYEELAMAILIGDGREDGDDMKISEEHIRSIWNDDDLYTIHTDVNIEAARKELQGTNTSANFGENYIKAEAIITAALCARTKYKGSGNMDFFCTPNVLNIMLLARDLNRRNHHDTN